MHLRSSDLNENQRLAVAWSKGPLLVLAGPGSGKTRVLTLRIARLIEESPTERFRVLGLTFTTKAADEMRNRIDAMVTDGRERVQLATFHSFAADILRQHGSHVGLKPDFVILNQTSDREAVLGDAIRSCAKRGIETDESDVRLLPLLDRFLGGYSSEEQVRERIREPDLADKVAALFTQYRLELTQANRLDFPCLLARATELIGMVPRVGKLLRTTYPYVCVDEFQDTNLAQYRFLTAIVGSKPRDLFVVADDDQIIYQWNGASPERLEELRSTYTMDVVQLPANYRCPPEVIDLANKLIQHNLSRTADKKPLVAIKTTRDPDSVRLEGFASLDDELAWVCADMLKRGAMAFGQCVVLGRTKKLLDQAVETLLSGGVKAVLLTRKDEFECPAFRWLHSILRLANARGEKEQLRRVCKAFFSLEGVDIRVEQVIASAAVTGGDYLRAWFDEAHARQALSNLSREFVTAGRSKLLARLDFMGFIELSLDWFHQLQTHNATANTEEVFGGFYDEECAWRDLVQSITDRQGPEVTLEAFLHEMDLSSKSPPPPDNAVRCLTIHGAKGMEFEHVYLIGLVEDQLPSFQAVKKGDESRELQEERRNCFVAITRAQRSLTLTLAEKYWGWPKHPSRFLSEMELI